MFFIFVPIMLNNKKMDTKNNTHAGLKFTLDNLKAGSFVTCRKKSLDNKVSLGSVKKHSYQVCYFGCGVNGRYGLVNVFADGLVFTYKNKQALVDYLNNPQDDYVFLSNDDVVFLFTDKSN